MSSPRRKKPSRSLWSPEKLERVRAKAKEAWDKKKGTTTDLRTTRWKNFTPEERQTQLQKMKEGLNDPAVLAKMVEARTEGIKRWYKGLTHEQKQELYDKRNKWLADMTPEEREAYREKHSARVLASTEARTKSLKATLAKLAQEEREALNAKRLAAQQTSEARAKRKQSYDVWRANMTDAERQAELLKLEKGRKARTKESYQVVGEANRQRQLGTHHPLHQKNAATENHFNAKYYRFRSPKNVIIEGKNLSLLIRKNVHMFPPETVVWKNKGHGMSCFADKGLRSLRAKHGKVCSWRGWTLVLPGETVEDLGYAAVK